MQTRCLHSRLEQCSRVPGSQRSQCTGGRRALQMRGVQYGTFTQRFEDLGREQMKNLFSPPVIPDQQEV